MKIEQPLPIGEQIEETRAAAEDRLEGALVPAMDAFFAAVSNGIAAAKEKLSQLRRA